MNPSFHRALTRWYHAHGRKDLPWRNTRDAYLILLSEIMLQQTQVKTVLDRYYTPFLHQFPTLSALAKAPRETVLKAWQGLGYYRRAINLHEAAKRCNGTLPTTIEGLLDLPGIGKNTAHAVASFAYGIHAPVLEANVKRVVARLFALETPSDNTLWEQAHALCKYTPDIFTHNQAMMDIGALICTPKEPKCNTCPINVYCLGKASPEKYLTKKQTKQVPAIKRTIVVPEHLGAIYMSPREGAHLGELYRFLEIDGWVDEITINGEVHPLSALPHHALTHSYSHYTLKARVVFLTLPNGFKRESNHWFLPAELESLPMSKLELKLLALVAY